MSSYIDHHAGPSVTHDWCFHTYENLAWRYGYARADAIIDGKDPKTQADIARWEALGRRSAA